MFPLPRLCYFQSRMPLPRPSRSFVALALAAALTAPGISIALGARPAPQVNISERVREVVATLATGQVTILVGQDGLVVAAVGNSFEPDSLPPLIVPLGERSLAIVLGADEWTEPPPASRTLLRLDRQLPHLNAGAGPNSPSLEPSANISQLEQLGIAVLEPLRAAAGNLHSQIQLPHNLPLTELVLIHQMERQQPLVSDVSFWIRQTFWQENFWDTEVERPRFMQLYPTKGDKSGIVQISYPPDDASPGLPVWLAHPTGPFAQAIATDPKLAAAEKEISRERLSKTPLAELVPLVKTALGTMAPAGTARALAAVDQKNGFAWIIQPPASKKAPVKQEPGAPSLENPPPAN